ncbi:MAG: adenylate/guanylate cyclase domain-containing protein [Desulfobacterales bacterium]
MKNWFLKYYAVILTCVGFTLVLVLLVLLEINVPILSTLELKSQDLRFGIRGVQEPPEEVVIVVIDDSSIEAIGRWPWPRSVFAQLIATLYEGGARAIGFDLIFTEPEDNPEMANIHELIDTYSQLGLLEADPRNQVFFEEMIETADSMDNDSLLASVAREAGTVVFAIAFVPSDTPPTQPFPSFLHKAAYASFENTEALDTFDPATFSGDLFPIPVLADAASSLGFANFIPDQDGVKRRTLLTLEYGGALFSPLAVRVAQTHLNLENDDLTYVIGKELKMGPYIVPSNNKGVIHINYYGPHNTIPFFALIDVLSGSVPPETFNGKSVYIGGAAAGVGDIWPNPFSPSYFGVEAQATITANILSQQFLVRPDGARYVDAAIIAAIGLILIALLLTVNMRLGVLIVLLLLISQLVSNQYIFSRYQIILLFVYPLLELVLISTTAFSFRFFIQSREKRQLKSTFEQYLSPRLVKHTLKNPEKLVLGGDKRELSVLFSDIESFTSISENLSPPELVNFMYQYLTAMTDIVMTHEGTLDKYIGDAIMSIHGAPEAQHDHEIRACQTAIDMLEALYELRPGWVDQGFPNVRIRVGVNSGDMIVGNMGSRKRFDYTVLGDNVNIASRLEGLGKLYGVKIIVGENTHKKVKDRFLFRELDYVSVKGKKEPVRIYEMLVRDYFTEGREYTFIDAFQKGLVAYRNQQWVDAIHFFLETLSMKPEDSPAALFVDRCEQMKQSPPLEDWNGAYIATEK